LRSDIKGTELPPANILIPLERQLIALRFLKIVENFLNDNSGVNEAFNLKAFIARLKF